MHTDFPLLDKVHLSGNSFARKPVPLSPGRAGIIHYRRRYKGRFGNCPGAQAAATAVPGFGIIAA